jgi:hypothetical protein
MEALALYVFFFIALASHAWLLSIGNMLHQTTTAQQ